MAMTERAFDYADVQSYELRKMRVLDGTAAKERANARRFEGVKLALVIIALLVYLLGQTVIEAKITVAGAEINELQATITDMKNNSAKADLLIGSMSSLERIETYAMNNLGMVYPGNNSIYYLDEDISFAIASGMNELKSEKDLMTVDADAANTDGFLASVNQLFDNWLHKTALAAND